MYFFIRIMGTNIIYLIDTVLHHFNFHTPSSRVEANLIYFHFVVIGCFCLNRVKKQSFPSRFLRFWNCDLRTDLFNGFLKTISPLLKIGLMSNWQKETSFVQIMHLKLIFSSRYFSYICVSYQMYITSSCVTFYHY